MIKQIAHLQYSQLKALLKQKNSIQSILALVWLLKMNGIYISYLSSAFKLGFCCPLNLRNQIYSINHMMETESFSALEVDDVKSAYSEAKANSLDVVPELRSEDWGQHHFCIKDPNGIYLDIVQVIEPTEEYQQGYDAE